MRYRTSRYFEALQDANKSSSLRLSLGHLTLAVERGATTSDSKTELSYFRVSYHMSSGPANGTHAELTFPPLACPQLVYQLETV